MKKFAIATLALIALAVPAFGQESLVARVSNLETKVDQILVKLDALTVACAAKPKTATAPACPCPCGCGETGVCSCGQGMASYRTVCENGVCRVVPTQAYQQQPQQYYQPQFQSLQGQGGGCANGQCGGGGRGIFRRR